MPPPTVVPRVDRLVADALVRCGYSRRNATLVVAVSGGPDSSTLLLALHRLAASHQVELHVAHLIHDLRGQESDEDAQFVAGMAEDLSLPVTVHRADPVAYQRENRISSFEQATRELRYAFLADTARRLDASAVAVGHTRDDQAETVLQHLLRGAGLTGLAGMREVTPWPWSGHPPKLELFRPLLQVTKPETEEYCRSLGRPFRTDSENTQPYFNRNRVRHKLLPLLAREYNPRVQEALVRLSAIAALDLDYLEQQCGLLWDQAATNPGPPGGEHVELDLSILLSAHAALRRMLLKKAYVTLAGDPRRLQEDHISAMAQALEREAPEATLSLPRGIWFHRTRRSVVFSQSPKPPCFLPKFRDNHTLSLPQVPGICVETLAGPWTVTVQLALFPPAKSAAGPTPMVAHLDPGLVSQGLTVRTRLPGDKFRPLGMKNEKKLQDFFVDAKVPRGWRGRIPLLVSDQGIAWVVGCRIADWAKVDSYGSPAASALRVEFIRRDQPSS